VVVLVDSGASHNFISMGLVKRMGLKVVKTPSYGVRLRDGHKKNTSECCKEVELLLKDFFVKETFFLFDLEEWILFSGWLG